MQDEYTKALLRHDAAYQVLKDARDKYCIGAVTDEEFCAALQAMRIEHKAFVIAFAKAAGH